METEKFEKLASDQIPVFNDTFIDLVKSGNEKQAALSAQQYTRDKLREDSFAEKIWTPIDIANDELVHGVRKIGLTV